MKKKKAKNSLIKIKKVFRFDRLVFLDVSARNKNGKSVHRILPLKSEKNFLSSFRTYFPDLELKKQEKIIEAFNERKSVNYDYGWGTLKADAEELFVPEKLIMVNSKKAILEDGPETRGHSEKEFCFFNSLEDSEKKDVKSLLNYIHQEHHVPTLLLSFTLLSTLTTFIWNKKSTDVPNFILSLTGDDLYTLKRLALLYCNIFERVDTLSVSAYNDIHLSRNDTREDVINKAYRCKDSVFIAFNPKREQMEVLQELYLNKFQEKQQPGDFPEVEQDDECIHPLGLCLIVTKKEESIPYPTLNLDIGDKLNFNLDNIFSKQSGKEFMLEIRNFLNFISKNYDESKSDFWNYLKNKQYYGPDLYLNAAYRLYLKYLKKTGKLTSKKLNKLVNDYPLQKVTVIKHLKEETIERNLSQADRQLFHTCDLFNRYFKNAEKRDISLKSTVILIQTI